MSVVAFERKPITGGWSESELNTIVAALSAALAPATGRQWETGTTENGDVQFYLLGSLPDQACELCLSRIGRQYILEDGAGRVGWAGNRRPEATPGSAGTIGGALRAFPGRRGGVMRVHYVATPPQPLLSGPGN